MKKILLLIFLLVIPTCVFADSITIKCPKGSNTDKEITCTISGNTSQIITSLSAQVSTSSNLEYVSFKPVTPWLGDGSNGNIELYTDADIKNDFDIGYLTFKLKDDQEISFKLDNIFFYGLDDSEITIEKATVSIKKEDLASSSDYDSPVNEPFLNDIVIDKYVLPFNLNEDTYELEIDDENSLKITPYLDDGSVSYEIIGNENLKDGSVIKINLTKDNGQTKTYEITIKKSHKHNIYLYIAVGLISLLLVIITINIIENKKNS